MTTENTEIVPETPAAEETLASIMAADAAAAPQDSSPEQDAGADGMEGRPEGDGVPEPDVEEYEWDGEKLVLPKKIIPALMKDADYRRKTQELAEQRKALEAEREEMRSSVAREVEDIAAESDLRSVQAQLKEYDKVDWTRLADEDFDRAQRLQFQRGLLRDQEAALRQQVDGRKAVRAEAATAQTAQRIKEAEDWASANIPGWNQGRDKELIEHARSLGFSEQDLVRQVNKPFVEALYYSWIGRQSIEKASKQPAPEIKTPDSPLQRVTASKPAPAPRRNLATASFADFVEMRKAGANSSLASL